MTRHGWWAFVAGWLLGGVFWVVSFVLGPTWPKVGAIVADLVVAGLLAVWLVRSGRRRRTRLAGAAAFTAVEGRRYRLSVSGPDRAEFLEDPT